MKNSLLLIVFTALIFSSFTVKITEDKTPNTITRTTVWVDGKSIEKTLILFDGKTSREAVIHTCSYLAKENIQLTFDRLVIGKSVMGVVGKSRIRIASGKITFPNGSSQSFNVGGPLSFRSLKIQYATPDNSLSPTLEMIETFD